MGSYFRFQASERGYKTVNQQIIKKFLYNKKSFHTFRLLFHFLLPTERDEKEDKI